AVVRYAGCGGGVAADSSVSNVFVSSADGAWSAAVGATTTESARSWVLLLLLLIGLYIHLIILLIL
nr:hypothetical protein [Tanacetum cinerariifolium]